MVKKKSLAAISFRRKDGYNESMKIWRLLIFGLFLALFLTPWMPAAQAQGSGGVLVMRIEDTITPASTLYLERAVKTAQAQHAEALILELDTPGGALEATFDMAEIMRNSSVPVIVYVAPRGAMAGSAGLLIALAAHANVMAPETTIGASSPVDSQGQDLSRTMQAKIANITKASIRAWSAQRPPEAIALAEAAIDQAQAVSASEALQAGLTDAIANDLDDLLTQMDGRTLLVAGQPYTLHTAQADINFLPIRLIEKLLGVLINPNIVFILLTIGVQAILIELSAPGGWVAGTVGIISLGMAAYGLGILPVNWVGLLIMAVSFVLFILDVKAATHGALTSAGILTFITGALILFNSPSTPAYARVSVPLVVGTALLLGLSFGIIVGFAVKMLKHPGYDRLTVQTGGSGYALTAISPHGQVRYQGQIWSAELESPGAEIAAGEKVEIVRREGLRLFVRLAKDDR